MDPLVLDQVGAPPESFPALPTRIGPLACMDPLVLFEAGALVKGLPTLTACIRLSAVVTPVPHEVRVCMEGFPALLTGVGLLTHVTLQMIFKK